MDRAYSLTEICRLFQMCGCIPQSLIDALKSMLSFNLLKSPSFWILALSGFLTMMGFFIPFLYLCKAATSKGVEKVSFN